MSQEKEELARFTLQNARANALIIGTAESCTGGMIGAALTDISGSSDVVDCGFITYSNRAKMDLLGVCAQTLDDIGAVSEEVARQMAEGVLKNTPVSLSVAVTGIAGPGGGSEDKPVGLVYIASARQDKTTCVERHIFKGDRASVRSQTVMKALDLLNKQMEA